MGQPKIANLAKLFAAITFNNENSYQNLRDILTQKFGHIDLESDIYNFNFTRYYEREMGSNLKKQFSSFRQLIKPEDLVDIKLWTNELEKKFSTNEKRQVNIDPGYLTHANIILATTKNYSHRIYLGKGIYGDIHFRYINGQFQPLEWTYPDYKQQIVIDFFNQIKKLFLESKKGKVN